MLRWRGLEAVPTDWGRCVVTIGVFDGVHRGHQALIGQAVDRAAARGVPSVLVTFDPHPTELVRPGSHPARLTTLGRRADLVAGLGVDAFCVLPFTPELARTEPDEFVHRVLVEYLHAAEVVVGRNFRFGQRAAGDVALLGGLGERFGFAVSGAELASDDGVTFSSTYVRSCIDAGDMAAATAALGRPHRVEGVVVHGARRGRDLGYPTANVSSAPYTALPADGIYAGRFVLGERVLPAAISMGTNPTFSGRERTLEVYVLDFDEDLYGYEVAVDIVTRIRGQESFDRVEALIAQMDQDVAQVRRILAG